MTWMVGQSALSAALQVIQTWEKWLIDQIDLLDSRETGDAGVIGQQELLEVQQKVEWQAILLFEE